MDQLAIFVLGGLAIWLSQIENLSVRRYACLVGLAGQPFWLVATWDSGQWGMFSLSAFYTLAWLKGLWTYWLAPYLFVVTEDTE